MGKSTKDFSLDLYAYVMAKKNNLAIKRLKVFFPKDFQGSHLGIQVLNQSLI